MRFGILGPLQVRDDYRRELVVGGPTPMLALVLLQAGEVLSSDRLLPKLWAGEPPPIAANRLPAHISRLRRARGHGGDEWLQIPGGSRCREQTEELDAGRFERVVEAGDEILAAGGAGVAPALARGRAVWRCSAARASLRWLIRPRSASR
jgi:DNA-binding SARP family transcriptional activator